LLIVEPQPGSAVDWCYAVKEIERAPVQGPEPRMIAR